MEDNKETKKLSFKAIWQALWKHKYLFIKTISATFVIACIYTLGLPNYYNASVSLAPETTGRSNNNSSLSTLASTFGISLGSLANSNDAIGPSLYPDMMKSVNFKASLFPIKVQELNSDDSFTYYDYIHEHQIIPWWNAAIKAIFNIFKSKEKEDVIEVNPFMLTKEQDDIIKVMNKKIDCEVDKKTNVINIIVTDQDPLVAAIMADSVRQRLQQAITAYRTSKARVNLEYNKKLYEESKAKYDVARQEYAAYADANKDVILQRDRNKLIELENEMQLRYQVFSTVAAQLQAAEAKLQEETPAFTILQSATVPLLKAGPGRSKLVIIYCFIAFLITITYVLYKEKYFIPLSRLALGFDWNKDSKKSDSASQL